MVCIGVLSGTLLLAYMCKGFSTLEVASQNVLLRILMRAQRIIFFKRNRLFKNYINIKPVKSMNLSMFSNVLTMFRPDLNSVIY